MYEHLEIRGIARIMPTRLFFFLLAASAICRPQTTTSAPTVLSQIRSHHQGIAIWWVGNAGWLIQSDNLLVGIDLDLSDEEKVQPPPITAEELAGELDVEFVSHHHGDHCNVPTIRTLAQRGKCTLVLPQPCLKELGEINIPKDRLVVPEPLHPFDINGIHVEPIHAIHGNQDFTVLTREPDFIEKIAHNCGYVLSIQGKRFLHPGDSVLTEEHLSLQHIDVLFVSPTVHNMYMDRSMVLISYLQPAYIFPQHFGTYRETPAEAFWMHGYPDELKQRLSPEFQKRYHKLKLGEMFVIR
jgi:L-ascorbate metabolism protein UlaG (beta-lactamase superfamily)